MATARETLQQLFKLNLDLIPLRPGSKIPQYAQWQIPCERTIACVINTFAHGNRDKSIWEMPAEQFTKTIANIGVLNEPSQVITLDCDSPRAGAALKAACDAQGGDFNLLYPETSWHSIKGQKAMFRRPKKMAAGRAVFKTYEANGSFDTVFELRGTGQDVLPPSYRADHDQYLSWLGDKHPFPHAVPPMPDWLLATYVELDAGQGGPIFQAMCDALKLSPDQRVRTYRATGSMTGYPDRLLGHVTARNYINATQDVEDLLARFEYVRVGKRWKPKGSDHSAGIVAPRNAGENWLCEHESDPLAGVFDAWRIVVDCAYDGDVEEAAKAALAEQQQSLKAAIKPLAHAVEGAEAVAGAGGGDEDPPPPPPKSPKNKSRPERKGKAERPAQAAPGQHGIHTNAPKEARAVDPIIHGLMQFGPGCHILSGMPKGGKSSLATSIYLTACTGVSLSCFRINEPVNALFLALDESVEYNLNPRILRTIQHRSLSFDDLERHGCIVEKLDDITDWAKRVGINCMTPLPFEWLPDEEAEEDIDKARLLRPRFNVYTRALYHYLTQCSVRVCILDTVGKARLAAPGMKSVYDRDLEDFAALNEIAHRAGCALFGLHHMNKLAVSTLASNMASSLGKVSGSNAISGSVQSIISMSAFADPASDPAALYQMEPKGHKTVIDHFSRDYDGIFKSAFALHPTFLPVDEDRPPHLRRPALEWTYMGPMDVLGGTEDKAWLLEYLFDRPEDDYHDSNALFAAATAAGGTTIRNRSGYRALLQRMVLRGQLDSVRGSLGGFRLSKKARAEVKARRDAAKF